MNASRRRFIAFIPAATAVVGCGGGGVPSSGSNINNAQVNVNNSNLGGGTVGGNVSTNDDPRVFTAAEYIQRMGAGINIGQYFDDSATGPIDNRWLDVIARRGFRNVRIPVKWIGGGGGSGFRSDNLMRSVRASVDAALSRNLFVVLNVHHEGWVGRPYNTAKLTEFRFLWRRILDEFGAHPHQLSFQPFNEPWEKDEVGNSGFSYRDVDELNATVQDLVRKDLGDSHRVLHFACNAYNWIGAPRYQQLGAFDPSVAMTVHYYLPLGFTHGGAESTYRWQVGSGDRVARLVEQFDSLQQWSIRNRCPVYLGEFGVIHNDPRYPKFRPDVLEFYRTVAREAKIRGWSYSVWDDNGWYQLLNRNDLTWQEDLLGALNLWS